MKINFHDPGDVIGYIGILFCVIYTIISSARKITRKNKN